MWTLVKASISYCWLQGVSLCLKTRKFCSWKQRHKGNGNSYQILSAVESVPWVRELYDCLKVCSLCFCLCFYASAVNCRWWEALCSLVFPLSVHSSVHCSSFVSPLTPLTLQLMITPHWIHRHKETSLSSQYDVIQLNERKKTRHQTHNYENAAAASTAQ